MPQLKFDVDDWDVVDSAQEWTEFDDLAEDDRRLWELPYDEEETTDAAAQV